MNRALCEAEWRLQLRTFRLPALMILATFFAILDPLTVKLMPELLSQFAGDITIIMPPPVPADAIVSYAGNLIQILGLVLILTAMGSISRERERGVTAWLLTMPVGRTNYLLTKLAVVSAGVVASAVVGTILVWSYTRSLLGPLSLSGTAVAIGGVTLVLLLVATVTVVSSALWTHQLAAGALGLGTLVAVGLVGSLLGRTAAQRYLPSLLLTTTKPLVEGTAAASSLAWPAAITVAVTVLVLVAGTRSFASREL